MAFDPKINRNEKDAIGDPGDAIATNTTEPWTTISLLKGLLGGVLTGITVTPSFTDDAAFTVGTTKVMPAAGTYRATRDSLDDNDAGAVALTAKRGLYVSPESPLGDSLVDDTNDRLNVGLIAAQNGVDGGAGATSAKTVRAVTSSDSPDITLLTTIIAALATVNTSVNSTSSQSYLALGEQFDEVRQLIEQVVANTETVRLTAATGSITSVTSVASDVLILASNSARKGATFFNDSTAILYLALANVTASSTLYTVQVPASGYYELPVSQGPYTGIVKGIWASANGSVRVTELS